MQELRSNATAVASSPLQGQEIGAHLIDIDVLTQPAPFVRQDIQPLPLVRVDAFDLSQLSSCGASEDGDVLATVTAVASIEAHQSKIASFLRVAHRVAGVLLSAAKVVRNTSISHSLHHRWASKDLERVQPMS